MDRAAIDAFLKKGKGRLSPAERERLLDEGAAEEDIDAALEARAKAAAAGRRMGLLLFAVGMIVLAGTGLFLIQKPAGPPAFPPAAGGEPGAFVGRAGYVVRLPEGYAAFPSFKDTEKTIEVVHFAKAGTDPTSFLDDGLFGPLGIVRLEVYPSEIGSTIEGLDNLGRLLSARAEQRKERFSLTHLQLASLRGIQLRFDVPFPRVEAYVATEKTLFSFYAGEEDEVYRTLLQSLRDVRSEL